MVKVRGKVGKVGVKVEKVMVKVWRKYVENAVKVVRSENPLP